MTSFMTSSFVKVTFSLISRECACSNAHRVSSEKYIQECIFTKKKYFIG